MKLITFRDNGGSERVGALDDRERVIDLRSGWDALYRQQPSLHLTSMLALIEAGDEALDGTRKALEQILRSELDGAIRSRQGTRVLAPVPIPAQIRDGLGFEKHLTQVYAAIGRMKASSARGGGEIDSEVATATAPPQVWYKQPIYYKGNRFSVVGPDADVIWPDYAQILDYELELGCFIKRRIRNATPEEARAAIFGYTIFKDVSARDAQMVEMEGGLGPAKGKDFDTGNVIGPCLVTSDELSDPYVLSMIARVNGEEWSRGSSSEMHWRLEDLIAFVSRSETIYPGEFIGSGTVGNGCGMELGRFPQPGDLVELEIEGIGTLRNRFVKAANTRPEQGPH